MAVSSKGSDRDRKRGRTRAVVVAILLAALILLAGGAFLYSASAGGPVKLMGSYATVHPVGGSYSSDIECRGTVQPIRVVDVHARAKGKVVSLFVHEGEYVTQGKPLFEVEDEQGNRQSVLAEIPGTVTNVKIAENMPADQLDSLDYSMQISDMNVLVGMVYVQEFAIPFVKAGEWARVTSEEERGISFDAMIVDLAKSSEADSSRVGQALYEATLLLDDADDLTIGMPIIAHIPINDYGQVFYVPASAVREENGLAYVDIVRSNGTIEQHQVELLGEDEDGSMIIKGSDLSSETIIRTDLGE